MAHVAAASVVRQLGTLFEGGSVAGLSDRQLLERFTAGRDRPGRRGRLRGAGGPARADGAGRLPAAPGRRAACRGRLPGRVPGPGPEGPVDPRPRPAGQLAVRGRDPDGAVRAAADRPPAQAGGRRCDETVPVPARSPRPSRRPRRPTGRSSTASRPRPSTARSTACPRPSGCRWCSATSRASPSTRPPGASAARPARSAAGWPGAGEAPDRPGSPRGRACPPPRWAPSWRPGRPRRPFLPSCAIPPPGPRSPSRPVMPPPAGRSPPPPRRWPRRS